MTTIAVAARRGALLAILCGALGCSSADSDAAAPAGAASLALEPTVACDAVADALYATPAGLPAFSADVRGKLLGCAKLATISSADLTTRLAPSPGVVVSSGDVRVYLIAYRTERDPGVGAISTALVYLPDVARSERVPMVLAAHGSTGLADKCAPSRMVRDPSTSFLPGWYFDALYMSWAAQGLPVVAPDYAGLGTDGIHAYANWADPARSAIDGVRALRSLLPASRLDGGTLVYGHSQGGGIALSVAAYAAQAPDLDLRAVVAFAPGYHFMKLVDVLRLRTLQVTPALRALAALYLYSDYANLTDDATHYGDAFAADVRGRFEEVTSTMCYTDIISTLDKPSVGYVPPTTVGAAIDSTFSAAALDCADHGVCSGLTGAWVARDKANDPHLSAAGPPVLIVGSTGDEQVSQGQIGCVLDALQKDGVTPDLCIQTGDDHLKMVATTTSYGFSWALAASTGAARPACTSDTKRVPCALF